MVIQKITFPDNEVIYDIKNKKRQHSLMKSQRGYSMRIFIE